MARPILREVSRALARWCICKSMLGTAIVIPRRWRYWISVCVLPLIGLAFVFSIAVVGGQARLWSLAARFRGDAPSTLLLFTDYACPACARYDRALAQGIDASGPVRVELRHFPLESIHPNALLAACAVEAAREQGSFASFHTFVFEHQSEWSRLPTGDARSYMIDAASRLGLSENLFVHALDGPGVRRRVDEDKALGVQRKVRGTPTFFLDEVEIRGLPASAEGIRRFFERLTEPVVQAKRRAGA
jgi:protein-disulfide isomerase